MEKTKGISFPTLVLMVITSAIGAGIFDLPRTLAQAATPGAALVAWALTGVGVLMLALTLNDLVLNKSKLTGISDYARDGFGDFTGFISGWGYWLSTWLGNVAFATMLMSAFGYFFPSLASGNSLQALIIAAIISFLLTILVSRGVESAAFINAIVTVCKLIPLFVFAVFAIIGFQSGIFTANFWQNFYVNASGTQIQFGPASFSGIMEQVKGCIMALMWVFVGMEGASMMAGRARKKTDAGKATIVGFLSLIFIYVIISMLPFGYFSADEFLNLGAPALVYLFEDMVGSFGGVFISIGLIVSILAAWLSWTMLPVEATSQMADQELLPKWFGKLNKYGAPANSLWLTESLLVAFLFSLLFTDEAYNFAYSLCTASIMICYAIVGAYQLKRGIENKSPRIAIIGFLALAFQLFALLLAGLQYVWICSIAYVLGFVFYIIARKHHGKTLLKSEWIAMSLITLLALGAVVFMATGKLSF